MIIKDLKNSISKIAILEILFFKSLIIISSNIDTNLVFFFKLTIYPKDFLTDQILS